MDVKIFPDSAMTNKYHYFFFAPIKNNAFASKVLSLRTILCTEEAAYHFFLHKMPRSVVLMQ